MKVVIDNNIVIDRFGDDKEFKGYSDEIFKLIRLDMIKPYVCVNSLTDIYYVLKKIIGSDEAKEVISALFKSMTAIPLNIIDCKKALSLPMNDFEDAIIAVSAKKVGADYVISRDAKFIKSASGVKVITPKELISIIRQ